MRQVGTRVRLPGRPGAKGLSRSSAALAVLAAASLAFAGCAADGPGPPSSIVRKAVSAQSSLDSVRMRLDSEFELQVPGARRSAAVSYEGVYQKPDRWRLKVRGPGGSSEVVIIGDRSYVKLPGSDTWIEKNGALLEGGGSPGGLVESRYLQSASNVRIVDKRGDSYHLSFDLDVARAAGSIGLGSVDPRLFRGRKAGMDVWVLKDPLRIKRATMRFSGSAGESSTGELSASMEVEFSEFDQPVSIEAPAQAP